MSSLMFARLINIYMFQRNITTIFGFLGEEDIKNIGCNIRWVLIFRVQND